MKASRVYRGFFRLAYVVGAFVYFGCLLGFLAYAVDQNSYWEPLKWAIIVATSAAAVCMGCIMLLAWIVAAFGEPGGEPKLSILGNPVIRIAAGLGFWGLWWEAMDVAGRWLGELLAGLVVMSLIGIAVAVIRPASKPTGDRQGRRQEDSAMAWMGTSPDLGIIEACFAGCWLIGALWLGWKLAWLAGDTAGVWFIRFVAPHAPTAIIALVGLIAGVFTFLAVFVIAHPTGDVVIHAARAIHARVHKIRPGKAHDNPRGVG